MVALYTAWSNFVRQHKAPRATPAMAAGPSDRLRNMGDVVTLTNAQTVPAKVRGLHKPRASKPKQDVTSN